MKLNITIFFLQNLIIILKNTKFKIQKNCYYFFINKKFNFLFIIDTELEI